MMNNFVLSVIASPEKKLELKRFTAIESGSLMLAGTAVKST